MSLANCSRRPNLSPSDCAERVRDVPHHPGHAHASVGRPPGAVVVPALPVRVGGDGVARDRVPGHPLRLQRVRAGDRNDGADVGAAQDGPLERLHAAERTARHCREARDAELVQERPLGADHVGHGDHREIRSVGPPGRGIRGRRARGAAAAAEEVRADDEELLGVEGLAGSDHAVPPPESAAAGAVTLFGAEPVPGARGDRRRRVAGRVSVAAQRVTDEDHVVAAPARAFRRSRTRSGLETVPGRNRGRGRADRGTASPPCRRSRRSPSG